jgi:hypothetical protein
MGRWTEGAKKVRAGMNAAGAVLTDEEALAAKAIYSLWTAGEAVAVGDKRREGDKLYKALQAHTTQAGWEPSAAAALWVEIAAPGEYREIKANMLSTEAFALNEIGWWQTKTALYKSLIAANVYTPASYPAGWEAL